MSSFARPAPGTTGAGSSAGPLRPPLAVPIVGALAFALFVGWEIVTPRAAVRIESMVEDAPIARARMAMLAVLGLGALGVALARLADRRIATSTVVVLATMPAWFVHGRTATAMMIPLAGAAFVLAGLAATAFDRTRAARVVGAAVAIGGIALAARGHALAAVVAPPLLAVGAAAWAFGDEREKRRAMVLVGAGVGLAGVAIALVAREVDGPFALVVVGVRNAQAKTTFDGPVAPLAYGLLPWSPLVALALGRRPRTALHLAVVLTAALAIGAHALVAFRSGVSPLVLGAAPIAASVAFAIVEVDGEPRVGALMPLVVVALGAIVAHDVDVEPERVMLALGAHGVAIPPPYVGAAAKAVRSSTWLATALAAIALAVPKAWLPAPRSVALVAAGALGGLVLRAHAYPTLLQRLSPGAAIDAFVRAKRPGDVVGVLGVDRRESGALANAQTFASSDEASRWLASAAPTAERRFLAFATPELPRLNAEFRGARHANVPILAGGDGLVLLATSSLARGEKSESTLDAIVLDRAPSLPHPLDAVVDDRLDVLGWELTDASGRRVDAVKSGRKAHVRVYVRLREGATPMGASCTFLHVDHTPTRFSAEHKVHDYPMTLWRGGDVVVDDFEITLSAAFRAGRYAMSWGVGVLPCEDDRRLRVTHGAHDGRNRITAGNLEVR